ncbi:MAG: transcription elongation factor GreB [Pseudomonadota bacterium]|nr:transcription elongation factor GreB [Pseudomonadota bacterium]
MSSCYITPAGKKRLDDELEYLWHKRRPEVVRALSAAAAEGDRSENAEYIYRKKELREIDRRVRYLSKRVEELKVVTDKPSDPARIFFGAWVELESDDGKVMRYRIVGPDEFDPATGCISMDSPVARALMRKQVDDEVTVQTPGGEMMYTILRISYEQ